MANTVGIDALKLLKWETDYFKESVRESGFSPYMGQGTSKPFVVKEQLVSGGQIITVPLVGALSGSGVGTSTLVGNEEALDQFSYDIKPYWHRHAVTVTKDQQHDSVIDLLNASKDMLKTWDMDEMRDGVIDALSAVAENSGSYSAAAGHAKQVYMREASAAQKNAWCAANANRVLFGADTSNYNTTFATALGAVSGSADYLGVEEIRLMKRIARERNRSTGRPSVRPIRAGSGGREYFVCFTNSANFARLKTDMDTINLDGRPRDPGSNPLFQDGDLMVDGVIIREIPEIPNGTDAGLSANIGPAYFCGAQALGFAWGQRPRATTRKEDDYGFIKGVGTESLWAVEKLIYDGLDHGLVTGFFSN